MGTLEVPKRINRVAIGPNSAQGGFMWPPWASHQGGLMWRGPPAPRAGSGHPRTRLSPPACCRWPSPEYDICFSSTLSASTLHSTLFNNPEKLLEKLLKAYNQNGTSVHILSHATKTGKRESLFLGPSLFVGGEAGRQALALEINPGRGIRQKSVEDDGALSEWSLLHTTVLLIKWIAFKSWLHCNTLSLPFNALWCNMMHLLSFEMCLHKTGATEGFCIVHWSLYQI